MKRITVNCTYILEGTKKEYQETFSVYTEKIETGTVQKLVDEVYSEYNRGLRPYHHKRILKDFSIERVVDI